MKVVLLYYGLGRGRVTNNGLEDPMRGNHKYEKGEGDVYG